MKRKRHTEEQIIAILKEHEAGMKTADLCRKHGISEASFYRLNVVTPFHHLSGDSHINSSLREGPLRHLVALGALPDRWLG
jgi:Transposase